MKIRTVIMFIAGGSLALPHIARTQDGPPRVELTSYYRQSFLYGSYERQGTLWTYDDYFELDYRTNSIYEHWEGNYPDPHVRGGWYTGTWPGLGVAGWLERYLEPSVAWPWPTESAGPTDPFDPNGMIFLHNGCFVVQHEDYFLGGDATEDACETSTIHLFTGHSTPEGTPGKVNLHRLRYTVRDRDTGFDVDHSQITMLVYAALPDDTAVDVTPSVTGSYFSTTYSVEHQWASLVLRDQLTGQHVTDQTNVVWVGERIHLSCSLSAQIAIVTNFQWTVPGKRIANWDVAADGRYARTHALTGIGTNGPTVQFHWVLDQAGTVDVVCKVQVEGETLTAKTTYEIRRPTASWNLYPQDVVQVTTNCWVSQPAFAGYYHLTTGKGWGITNYGLYYVGYMDDLKG